MKQLLTGMSVIAFSALAIAQADSTTTVVQNTKTTTPGASRIDTTTNAATTSAAVDEMKPVESKWGAAFAQGFYAGMNGTNRGDLASSTVGDAFFAIKYKIDDVQKLQLRQNFLFNETDPNKNNEWSVYDFTIKYDYGKAFQLFGSDVASETRFYIPVGEWSREIGKLEFRQALIMSQTLTSNLSLDYFVQGRFYDYTEDEAGQRYARSFAAVTGTYQANKTFSPYITLQHQGSWRNPGRALRMNLERADDEAQTMASFGHVIMGTGLSFSENVSASVYLEQVHDLRADDAFVLMNEDDDTYYNLELSISI